MRYIRRSLPSLLASDLPAEARVVFVDDCSPNPQVWPFLQRLAAKYECITIWRNSENLGPNKGQAVIVPRLWEQFPDAPYIVCADDDVIYHPEWLRRLIKVYNEAKALGVDGVFTALNTPVRPHYAAIRLPSSEVLLKTRQMALNWLVPRKVYEHVGEFRAIGVAYDTDYCNRMAEKGIPIVCLKPSYVQNIGYRGAYQSDDTCKAHDYVGALDPYLLMRDYAYAVRRELLNLSNRVPEGRFKRIVKQAAIPIRKAMGI
jgi:GT2 family glycosyltransferase